VKLLKFNAFTGYMDESILNTQNETKTIPTLFFLVAWGINPRVVALKSFAYTLELQFVTNVSSPDAENNCCGGTDVCGMQYCCHLHQPRGSLITFPPVDLIYTQRRGDVVWRVHSFCFHVVENVVEKVISNVSTMVWTKTSWPVMFECWSCLIWWLSISMSFWIAS